jgi:YVTN family beta-propeller protein
VAVGRRIAAGDVVAGYEIGVLLGRGGTGEVYRAVDVRLERPVALKLLTERLSDDEAFRERLLRESRIAASLDHPNVVPIYEAGEEGGRLFIAMRYVDGPDLGDVLRQEGVLAPERTVAIAEQIAEALDAAHGKGLVHRDVKPSNILLDQQGERDHAYLADFGLTQSASDRGPTDGRLMGTVGYVAPEQIRGDPIDGRADVYALGCLLFEALTGTLPFTGASDVAVIYAHLQDDPSPASERRATLPAALDAVLARAMAKDPEDRQPTCRQLVDEVREALGLVPRTVPRRNVALALAAVAILLVAAAVVAAILISGSTTSAQQTGGVIRIDARTRVASRGVVWAASTREGALWKVNEGTGAVQRLAPNGTPRDLAVRGDRVFVASDGQTLGIGTVSQYELASGFPHGSVNVLACSLTAGAAGVWAAGCPDVVELRPGIDELRVGRTVPIPQPLDATAATTRVCLCGMASGLGSVWVIGDWTDPRLWRVDPRTARVAATIDLPFGPQALAVGAGAVWVADFVGDRVVRLDPSTGARTAIPAGRGPVSIAVGADAVWVANRLDRTVARLDPTTLAVTDTVALGKRPTDIAVDGSSVWVAVEEDEA